MIPRKVFIVLFPPTISKGNLVFKQRESLSEERAELVDSFDELGLVEPSFDGLPDLLDGVQVRAVSGQRHEKYSSLPAPGLQTLVGRSIIPEDDQGLAVGLLGLDLQQGLLYGLDLAVGQLGQVALGVDAVEAKETLAAAVGVDCAAQVRLEGPEPGVVAVQLGGHLVGEAPADLLGLVAHRQKAVKGGSDALGKLLLGVIGPAVVTGAGLVIVHTLLVAEQAAPVAGAVAHPGQMLEGLGQLLAGPVLGLLALQVFAPSLPPLGIHPRGRASALATSAGQAFFFSVRWPWFHSASHP